VLVGDPGGEGLHILLHPGVLDTRQTCWPLKHVRNRCHFRTLWILTMVYVQDSMFYLPCSMSRVCIFMFSVPCSMYFICSLFHATCSMLYFILYMFFPRVLCHVLWLYDLCSMFCVLCFMVQSVVLSVVLWLHFLSSMFYGAMVQCSMFYFLYSCPVLYYE
jgi:hypothetical protein